MNAAGVLAEAMADRHSRSPDELTAALLAHGEQGVAILPDGTLWALEGREPGFVWAVRLVPLSAEAGDTDG